MDFNDKIKIAFNWIGPKGPACNTEVPNIMELSHISVDTGVPSSHKWNVESTYSNLFAANKEDFKLYPTASLTKDDVFIFPLGLSWRIPFNYYFITNTGILEYSHTPQHVKEYIKSGKGFILLDLVVEGFINDEHLFAIHNYFGGYQGLPLNRIIYYTGCVNAQELYNNFCERNNISDNPSSRLSILCNALGQNLSKYLNHGEEPEYDISSLPEKTFLCPLRRFREHRLELAIALEHVGLIDHTFMSLGTHDPENYQQQFSEMMFAYLNTHLDVNMESAHRLNNKLPLIIDGTTDMHMLCEDYENKLRPFCQRSLVSIIAETNFREKEITLTEKTFKPIKDKHPFIILGPTGTLRHLRNFGYKTFNEFWNEDYDCITDGSLRIASIVKVAQEIHSWSADTILEFKRKVRPILEYNYMRLKEKPNIQLYDKVIALVRNNI